MVTQNNELCYVKRWNGFKWWKGSQSWNKEVCLVESKVHQKRVMFINANIDDFDFYFILVLVVSVFLIIFRTAVDQSFWRMYILCGLLRNCLKSQRLQTECVMVRSKIHDACFVLFVTRQQSVPAPRSEHNIRDAHMQMRDWSTTVLAISGKTQNNQYKNELKLHPIAQDSDYLDSEAK